ncbi:MAG: Gfo/Idh/MocA family protein [Phycisphaeraceae bacterium]
MTKKPSTESHVPQLRLGCVGLAGYAEAMSGVVLEHGGSTSPPVELVAAAGPEAAAGHERVGELEGQGVRVFADLDAMLNEAELDAAWVLAPIHLHEPLTRRCLDAGLHVLCEKPAAGSVAEVQRMIEQRDAAGKVVLIGFQDVYDPSLLELKRRMIEGRLGGVRRIAMHGLWPRGEAYFHRNNWAGRLTVDGRAV